MDYDIEKFEKYKSKEEETVKRDFHKNRTAFLILSGEVKFLTNSGMSHLEWAKV